MNLVLRKADANDLMLILELQIEAFQELLHKYQDYDTNPGNEAIEDIKRRYGRPYTDYLLIDYEDHTVGAVRLVKHVEDKIIRISPIFIHPDYQGKGITQKTFKIIEETYDWVNTFQLDTILEEEKLCYLYEKLGYKKTGHYEKLKEDMTIVYYEKEMKRKEDI